MEFHQVFRAFVTLPLLVLLLGANLASAQLPPSPPAPPVAPAAAPVSADELQRLLDALQNPQDRAKLAAELRALIAAERAEAPPPAAAPAPASTPAGDAAESAPTTLDNLTDQLHAVSTEMLATASVVIDAPRLLHWIEAQASDAQARARWAQVLLHLTVVFGLAIAAEMAVRWMLTQPRSALATRTSPYPILRLVLMVLKAIIDLLPILVFAAVALLVLPLLGPRFETERVVYVMVRAILIARTILVVTHGALLSPGSPMLLLGFSEETRNYLYIWVRRFVAWAVYGYALADASWWLGAPGGIYATLLKAAALVLAILAVVFVLQNRRTVGGWMRGESEALRGSVAWRTLRHRLADTWHVLAIVYVVGLFGVYALRIPGGFSFLLRASVLSILLIVAAKVVVRVITGLARRGFAVNHDLRERFPTLEARANRYLPALSALCATIVYFLTAIALLQAWGIDAFHWFDSGFGRHVAGSAITIGAILAIALLIWEIFSSAVERYLAEKSQGGPVVRNARIRTLLPLARTGMAVLLFVLAGLMVLSELGVNIAPLLAGAGIVGLAVGFGSQALVKDVINGLFILIEDTLAVGDVVDVGSGHTGTVERISIRSLKLRDMAGTVHTIPFSSVTTVKNLAREYAYVVADIGVLFREDPDRVAAVLREVGAELQQDSQVGDYIMEPLEIVGLDRFTDTAMVVRVRIKTRPLRQWVVGREFNRRLKKAFDRSGIEMPSANQTRYLPTLSQPADGGEGSEPPAAAEGVPAAQ